MISPISSECAQEIPRCAQHISSYGHVCKEKVIQFCKANSWDFLQVVQFWDDLVELRLSGGKKKLKRSEMGEKNCHVCQQKENKSQKLYCVFYLHLFDCCT